MIKRTIEFITIIICCVNYSLAKNVDSIFRIWLNTENDPRLRIEAIEDYPYYNSRLSNDSVLQIIGEVESLIEMNKLHDLAGIVHVMRGNLYTQRAEYSNAASSFDSALVLYGNEQNIEGMFSTHTAMGINFRQMGLTGRALRSFQTALKYNRELDDTNGEGDMLLNIGVLCADMGKYDRSTGFYNDALEIYNEVDDQIGVVYVFNNKAENYLDQNRLKEAFDSYTKALEHGKSIGFDELNPDIFSGLSKCHFQLGNAAEGENFAIKAVNSSRKFGMPFLTGQAFLRLGSSLLEMGQNKRAFENCERALKVADSINSKLILKDACFCLYNAYRALNNGDKAFIYLDRYLELSKLLEKEAAIETLEKFEYDKKIYNDSIKHIQVQAQKRQVQLTKLKHKKRKNRIQYSAVIIMVLFLATVIAIVTKFKISPRLASGLIFIFFILIFEFFLVVLDPWVDNVSNGEVGWKIGINTVIALVLFGIHQASEKKLKNAILKVER
ncbi:MAG: tetratricopeptide repeat protein [Bacteroidia bacterium]